MPRHMKRLGLKFWCANGTISSKEIERQNAALMKELKALRERIEQSVYHPDHLERMRKDES